MLPDAEADIALIVLPEAKSWDPLIKVLLEGARSAEPPIRCGKPGGEGVQDRP